MRPGPTRRTGLGVGAGLVKTCQPLFDAVAVVDDVRIVIGAQGLRRGNAGS